MTKGSSHDAACLQQATRALLQLASQLSEHRAAVRANGALHNAVRAAIPTALIRNLLQPLQPLGGTVACQVTALQALLAAAAAVPDAFNDVLLADDLVALLGSRHAGEIAGMLSQRSCDKCSS